MKHAYQSLIVPLTILAPIAAAVYKGNKLSPEARIGFIYLLVAGIVNTTGTILAKNGIANLPLLHAYTVAEFVIISLFYKTVITDGKKDNRFLWLQIFFLVACIVNAVFFQKLKEFNSHTLSLKALLLMLLALNYFAKLFTVTGGSAVTTMPNFWFNVGLFLYFSGSLFLYIFSNYTLHKFTRKDFVTIWDVHATFVMTMYLLFTVAFFKCKK